MKSVALIFILLYIWSGSSDAQWRSRRRRCFTRTEQIEIDQRQNNYSCDEPHDQMMTLPVPDEYDYVIPSMAIVKNCSNLMCTGKNKACGAVDTKEKRIKVEAIKEGPGGTSPRKYCTEIIVKEHLKCGCGCEVKEDCPSRKIFDEEHCSCVCKDDDRKWCLRKNSTMWNGIECQCRCKEEGDENCVMAN